MTRSYRLQSQQGVVEIRLDSEGQVMVNSPHGPMVMDIWTLEDAFVEEFDGLNLPDEELRSVYRSFVQQHPSRRSTNASEAE